MAGNLDLVPREIRDEIALKSDVTDILILCTTSKSMRDICARDDFWIKKYRHDFGEELPLAASLALTPQQAYIQRYTLEGGVTFGSQLFQSINNLLPRALQSGDTALIDFYLDLLEGLMRKARAKRRNISLFWPPVFEAALNLPDPVYMDKILALGNKYELRDATWIKALAYATGRGFISRNKYPYLLAAYKETPNKEIILAEYMGALEAENYALALELSKELPPQKALVEVYKAGRIEFIPELLAMFGMSDEEEKFALTMAVIKAGIRVAEEEIPTSINPEDVIQQMFQTKNYNLNYVRSHLDPNVSWLDIPCDPELLDVLREKGMSEAEISNGLNRATCQVPFLKELDKYTRLEAYKTGLRRGNIPIIIEIIREVSKGKYNSREMRDLAIIAFITGRKDLWFYLGPVDFSHKIGSYNSLDMEPFFD
jgi:hypothetical protein